MCLRHSYKCNEMSTFRYISERVDWFAKYKQLAIYE
jgi:hypothetical protein